MKLLNLSSPQDFMALLVRRKRWIVYPFIALTCAVVVLTYMLPKVYVSEALILIRPRDVPTDFVKDLIAGSTESRLSAIEQTVLSRTNLTQIARDFEDGLPEFKKLSMDDRVVKLRKQIILNFQTKDSGQLPVTYFSIGYQNRDPELAQKIADKITRLFITKDFEAREDQVNGTVTFLSGELEKLYTSLKESDKKLKLLRARHRNELPSQLEPNLRRQENLIAVQQSQEEQALLIGDMKRKLEQQIAVTPKEIPKPIAPVPPIEIVRDPNIAEYRRIKAELKDMATKGYLENYPNVRVLNRRFDELKKEMTPEDIELAEKKEEKPVKPEPGAVEMMPNPAYTQLLEQQKDFMREVGITEKRRIATDQGVETYSKRIENEPQVEEEMVDILRENGDLNRQYDAMKGKLSDSMLSLSLESKQKGAQFIVQDPPIVPTSPAKPQKYLILAMGTLISLLAGIAFGFIADVANQKMWTSSDIEALLGATVLVEIPEIVTPADTLLARRKRLRHIASLVAVTAVYGVGLYFIYLHQSFVLRHLDPLLQRLY